MKRKNNDQKEKMKKQQEQASKSQELKQKEPARQEAETEKNDYQNLRERYLRLQADFDNYKKRSLQDKSDFIKFANQGLIAELIGILDNFELSIKYAEQKNDFKLMHQGVDMIIKQLHALLRTKGLEKIKTVGEKFDPHRHDALEIAEDDSVEIEKIVEELQPGYLLSGRILRPAKVKVVKPKTDSCAKLEKSEEKEGQEIEIKNQKVSDEKKSEKEGENKGIS